MKCRKLIFLIACLALCVLPSVGMLFYPTTESTENRAMAEKPTLLTEEDMLNKDYFADLEAYFDDHMALRNPLLRGDAEIQTRLFGVSNVSGVIRGRDGWLYYASTLEDYLGNDVLSPRELYDLAHNLSVVSAYLRARGIRFLLTIPPNKNTLYGENMPYYDRCTVSANHSAELLKPLLRELDVPYLDLFRRFREEDEVLYCKRDSHWNGKGAMLAYEAIMGDGHRDYGEPSVITTRDGDLNRMLYNFYGPEEEDYAYAVSEEYRFTQGESVEDGWIATESEGGEGTLLMFRDSFANTLIPLLSNEYERAYYSKGEPNALERYVESCDPDRVILEKVERNIAEYLNDPPILSAPETAMPTAYTITSTDTEAELTICENDVNYYKLTGTADPARLEEDSDIIIEIDGTAYRAYQTGENGFLMYLKKSAFPDDMAEVRVYIVNEEITLEAFSWIITVPK